MRLSPCDCFAALRDATTEVIVTTHGNAWALDLALIALARQHERGFSVCVAEDGEDSEAETVVANRRSDFPAGALRHVRQPHQGFRKNRILNTAVASSRADYLVFLDGDCLAGPGFVGRHLDLRRAGRFLTGGVVRLPEAATRSVTADIVADGLVFDRAWLRAQGAGGFRNALKSQALPKWLAGCLERLTPVARTWNGGNVSGWRDDLMSVNGFDESLGCGGEDVDLGFRLNHVGVVGRHVRYSATVVHLHHERPYEAPDERQANIRRVWAGKATAPARASQGIVKS